MRLITEKGQVDIPGGFSFTIEQNSPVFSKEGSQSLPITLPDTPRNMQVLDYPTRPGRKSQFLRKIPAKLEAGVIQKDGQLVIDSGENRTGIVAALMLNESDLYTQIKDVKLADVFKKIIRDDYSAAADKVTSWYTHIYNCMRGSVSDDFTAFPVAINYSEDSGYEVLNRPDHTSGLDPWALIYAARTITSGEEEIDVPAGYGITPFLWMYRVIELLFAEFGYSVGENPFKIAGSPLRKVVLLNNTIDSICIGKIRYSDLVPDISVSEFIVFLESKFGMHIYASAELKRVDVRQIETVLLEDPDQDITPFACGQIKYLFTDPLELDLTSDTSLDGATPAADTIFDLAKKYSSVTKVDEATWRSYAWGSLPAFQHHLILRKANGQYYDIYFRRPNGDGPTSIKRLGSNYFRYFTNRFKAKELKSIDVMPPMVMVTIATVNSVETNIMCPYVGKNRFLNTATLGENDNTECKLMIAFAAGKAAEFSLPAFNSVYLAQAAAMYYLGTTQKYDNAGNLWSSLDLTTTDLYPTLFKRWNAMLMNSGVEVECKVDYPLDKLLSLKMHKLKLLSGQKLLPESLSFSVFSNKIEFGTSKFYLVKNLSPASSDPAIPL